MKFEDELRKRWKITGPAIFIIIIILSAAVFSTAANRVRDDQWFVFQGVYSTLPPVTSTKESVTINEGTTKTHTFQVPANVTSVNINLKLIEKHTRMFSHPDDYRITVTGPDGFTKTETVSVSSSRDIPIIFNPNRIPENTEKYSYTSIIEELLNSQASTKGSGSWTLSITLIKSSRSILSFDDITIDTLKVLLNSYDSFDVSENRIIKRSFNENIAPNEVIMNQIKNVLSDNGLDITGMGIEDIIALIEEILSSPEGIIRDGQGHYEYSHSYTTYSGKVQDSPYRG